MTLHPEAQEKAQSELDLVIGKGRLPLFSDRVSLPYLEAVYRETFRWYPILPLGELITISVLLFKDRYINRCPTRDQ